MQTVVDTSQRVQQVAHRMAPRTLDELLALPFAAHEPLYRAAPTPSALTALNGDLVGRMLAVHTIDNTPLAGPLRAFAASDAFVWAGKSFTADNESQGTGINRVQVPGVLGRQRLFPFATYIGASAIDGRPAVILNYDLAENPPYIRRIHDEVREVSKGLYLGPAMWKGANSKTTVLWFGLDTGCR